MVVQHGAAQPTGRGARTRSAGAPLRWRPSVRRRQRQDEEPEGQEGQRTDHHGHDVAPVKARPDGGA